MAKNRVKHQPSFKLSLFVILTIMSILVFGIVVFDIDIHSLLLIAISFITIVSFRLGYTFDDLTDAMRQSIYDIMPALMIFIMIGVLIGSWIISGTVPTIIYYGLKLIRPNLFLPIGLILCSITSLAIGTSWGAVGTVGIALMGMGGGLGIPPAMTAGMIVSGAYFGDKMSPISDTTNLASASVGANLYDHIKAMTYTTFPSYVIVLLLFTLMGMKYSGANVNISEINTILETLESSFNINILIMLPMIILFVLNIKRVPAVPAMMIGAFSAMVIAFIFQGEPIKEILLSLNYGYTNESGVELVDKLLNRGGIQSMMWTFSLTFIAISLGSILEKVGYLKALIRNSIEKINNPGLLSMFIIFSTTLGSALMGELFLSIILNANLYKDEFKKKGYKPEMLSRLLEEGGTLTHVFIPWTTGAAFISSTLGVSTFAYAPYALLNYINPILSIVLSFLGIYVLKEGEKDKIEI